MLRTILWRVLEEQSQIPARGGVQSAAPHHHPLLGERCSNPVLLDQVICMTLNASGLHHHPLISSSSTDHELFTSIDSIPPLLQLLLNQTEKWRIFKKRFAASALFATSNQLSRCSRCHSLTVLIFRTHQKEPLWNTGQSLTAVCPAGEKPGLHLTEGRASGDLHESPSVTQSVALSISLEFPSIVKLSDHWVLGLPAT